MGGNMKAMMELFESASVSVRAAAVELSTIASLEIEAHEEQTDFGSLQINCS